MLVWTKAPFLFRNELVAVDGLADAVRAAEPGEVKRLGSDPLIVLLAADGGAGVEVAIPADSRERALGPLESPAAAASGVPREPEGVIPRHRADSGAAASRRGGTRVHGDTKHNVPAVLVNPLRPTLLV